MGREEQVEEREVLESIFPEEITGTLFGDPLNHEQNLTFYLQIYQRHAIE